MGKHVHDEVGTGQDRLARWSASRMLKHLRDVHGLNPPMAWDLGRLHQAHLEDHQASLVNDQREILNRVRAPEPDICEAYFGLGGGKAATCQRPKNHPEITQDGIGHSIFAHPEPKETPMPKSATDDLLEKRAKALYDEDTPADDPAWDEVGQETRDHYRNKVRQREIGYGAAGAERAQAEGERQILVDRLICAMTGTDFDELWAADGGMGPQARGLLRNVYGGPAAALLRWLDRGGVLFLPSVAKLGDDYDRERALVMDLEQANNDLRTELADTGRILGEVTEQRDGYRNQLRGLTEERDQLDTQLSLAQGDLEALVAQRDQLQSESAQWPGALEAVTAERDEARTAFDRLNAQRVETEAELRDERDQALEAVMAAQAKAAALRTERDEARHTANMYAVRAAELQERMEASTVRHIPLPGQGNDVADTIGRARAAVELRAAGKHFGRGQILLFTKDAVRNVLNVLADQLENTAQPGQPG